MAPPIAQGTPQGSISAALTAVAPCVSADHDMRVYWRVVGTALAVRPRGCRRMTPLGDIERPGGGRCRIGGLIAFSQAKTNDQCQEKRMSSATPPGPASRDRRIVAWPLAAAATALAFLLT